MRQAFVATADLLLCIEAMSRKAFAVLLEAEMERTESVHLITADLGFGVLDGVRSRFSERTYNTGAAEQLMLGIACGLADSGRVPVCYSITPFLLYRPFEFLRTYVNHESIPVKLVGCGRDKDYSHDGVSHWADDDERVLAALPNIRIFKPADDKELELIWRDFLFSPGPAYLNLTRF